MCLYKFGKNKNQPRIKNYKKYLFILNTSHVYIVITLIRCHRKHLIRGNLPVSSSKSQEKRL